MGRPGSTPVGDLDAKAPRTRGVLSARRATPSQPSTTGWTPPPRLARASQTRNNSRSPSNLLGTRRVRRRLVFCGFSRRPRAPQSGFDWWAVRRRVVSIGFWFGRERFKMVRWGSGNGLNKFGVVPTTVETSSARAKTGLNRFGAGPAPVKTS